MFRTAARCRSGSRPTSLIAMALLIAVAMLCCLAACSSPTVAGQRVGDKVLKFGLSDEPQPIQVGADQSAVGYFLNSLIHRGLLQTGADGKVQPALAQSCRAVNNATYRIVLRPGLTFSDGRPLTAANVKHTLTYLSKPDHGARTMQAMHNIKTIAVADDRHLTIHLRENDPAFPEYLADPTAFIAPDDTLEPGAVSMIGAGPFTMSGQLRGVSMSLVRNDRFYDAAHVALDGVQLNYFSDPTARTNALISGGVDMIDYVAWQDFARLGSTAGVTLDAKPGLLMDVEFNTTKKPFDDPRVRQAVAYAVNRRSVVQAAFVGHAKALNGLPVAASPEVAEGAADQLWDYDPTKARKLLRQAGYPHGFDTTLLTSSQYSFHQDTALTVQADLAKVGIKATLKNPDWVTRTTLAGQGAYGIKIGGWGGLVQGPEYIASFLGGPPAARSYGKNDQELMRYLSRGRTAESVTARRSAYRKAFALIGSQVPLVPLAQRDQAYAYSDRVSGFVNQPGFMSFNSGYMMQHVDLTEERR